MNEIITKDQMYKAVGPCPLCGNKKPWLNDIPLTAFCWGSEDKPHIEVRRVVPSPFQVYGQTFETQWRKVNGHLVK